MDGRRRDLTVDPDETVTGLAGHAPPTDTGEEAWTLRAELPDSIAAAIARVRPFTMVPAEALVDLGWQVCAVLDVGVPGDFVECGVWRGGAAFLAADLLRQAGVRDRKVWLFDSFEGLPTPEAIDENDRLMVYDLRDGQHGCGTGVGSGGQNRGSARRA